jgi:hypothetical protein
MDFMTAFYFTFCTVTTAPRRGLVTTASHGAGARIWLLFS